MKLKLSQLSHRIAILIENYNGYIRIYYADGHYEIILKSSRDLERMSRKNHKYKNPIVFESSLLFPTHNQKDYQCKWINLDYLAEKDISYIHLLEEKGLKVPKTWEEIVDPKYKDEIIMANPAVSGTSFANVKGLIDKYGEEKAWEYFKKLNDNVKFYGKEEKIHKKKQ